MAGMVLPRWIDYRYAALRRPLPERIHPCRVASSGATWRLSRAQRGQRSESARSECHAAEVPSGRDPFVERLHLNGDRLTMVSFRNFKVIRSLKVHPELRRRT